MKKLTEVVRLTGLDRRTIQEAEKYGVCPKPKGHNKYKALLYSEEEIDRLWQVRFYKELGYNLPTIKKILNDPNYDRQKAIRSQIAELEKKRDMLDTMLSLAKLYAETGLDPIDRRFRNSIWENISFDELIMPFALTDVPEDNEYEPPLDEETFDTCMDIIASTAKLWKTGAEKDSPAVLTLIGQLREALIPLLSRSMIVLSSAASYIAPGSGPGQSIDEEYGAGFSEFLYGAILVFCDANRDEPTDYALNKAIKLLDRLSGKNGDAAVHQAQAAIEVLDNFLAGIKLISNQQRIQLFRSIAQGAWKKRMIWHIEEERDEKRKAEMLADLDFFAQAVQRYLVKTYGEEMLKHE